MVAVAISAPSEVVSVVKTKVAASAIRKNKQSSGVIDAADLFVIVSLKESFAPKWLLGYRLLSTTHAKQVNDSQSLSPVTIP